MTAVIGINGKKGSGKSTLARKIGLFCYPSIQLSFADPLKRFCIEVLGLTSSQVYGSDTDKNTLTEILWENVPYNEGRTGPMTARQVMQHWGTEVFRRVKDNIHIDRMREKILRFEKADEEYNLTADEPVERTFYVIDDVRFPDEADFIKESGGVVIHLERGGSSDTHASETSMSDYPFDLVIPDNLSEAQTLEYFLSWFNEVSR